MHTLFVENFSNYLCKLCIDSEDDKAVGYLDAVVKNPKEPQGSFDYNRGYGWGEYSDPDFAQLTASLREYANIT